MNEEQQFALLAQAMVKAAAAGYTQSLINNGCPPEQARIMAAHYVDGTNGTLVKRAAKRERIHAVLFGVQG